MCKTEQLVAPFPYFGGKRRALDIVWPRFGEVDNYVEPFCGSLAMLLGAPEGRRVETINDANGFVANFWRAIANDPEAVAHWADYPVSEIDLHARHGWLVNRTEKLLWSLEDPDHYDAKIAGWWVWGACAWIGSGWCLGKGPWKSNGVEIVKSDSGQGINRKLPHVGDSGQGINRQLPHVSNSGPGINRKLPHVGDSGRGEFILDWFNRLSDRIRDVRVCCGDWSRIVTPVVTTRHGVTAVFLDPPYDTDCEKGLYGQEGAVSTTVRNWCLKNGNDPDLRIALCGYDGEHDMPGWSKLDGKATNGGYGNSAGNANANRERIWFSPSCIDLEKGLNL